MKLLIANNSGYPRIGDAPEEQELRRATDAWEDKRKSDGELEDARDAVARKVIAEQLEAGVDLPTDGQVRWHDPVSHLLRRSRGVELGGLIRLYDTNFYYRRPLVKGAVRHREPVLLEEFRFAQEASAKPVKVALTGPYTLAALSLDRHYGSRRGLAMRLAAFVAAEVEALAEAGCGLIQLDEPEILRPSADWDIVAEATSAAACRRGSAKIALAASWGDAAPLYEKMQKLDVDILGLDLTYSPGLPERLKAGSDKLLALGVVDGRNTRLEDPRRTADAVGRILARYKKPFAILMPSCSLEFVPRSHARRKLALLGSVRARLA
ncbi:MAG: hypothetical protein HY927_15575 [Elusimicrobia bacterium]|nr:hypothetical protein [Elusimicrobiota bacterium]